MNPKRFLLIIGPVLIVVGLAGLTGVLGSIAKTSFFHPPYWINWVHLTLGCVVLTAAFNSGKRVQLALTTAAMVLGLILGVFGLLLGSSAATRFNIPELADPSDHIAHLTVGLFALWGFLNRKH